MNLTLLLKTPLFRGLREEELLEVFSALKITETAFRKGEVLAFQDEPCNRLIILLSGTVKGEMGDPSGKVFKVEDIRAPSPLAILFLFGEESRFPVQATAVEDVTALVIPKPSVLRMLSMNEKLLQNHLGISSDFASMLSRRLNFMSLRTIRQKLALYIANLSREMHSDTVELQMSKSALAEYFGVSRPSLERELTNMQREGVIRADRRKLTVVDRNALVRMIDV